MKKTLVFLITFLSFSTILKAQKPVYNNSVFSGVKVPLVCASGDTTRTPIFFQAKLSGLTASAKYKYYVSFINISDTSSSTVTGAGEDLLFKGNGSIQYINSPGFTFNNHDTLTVSSGGQFTGWFGALTTNSTNFTAGRYVYPMIVLQEVKTGTPPTQKYYLTDSIKVLSYSKSAGSNFGTGIYGNSYGKSKNLVLLYDDSTGASARPVSITYLENDGNNISGLPAFYTAKVNGVAGAWGTIIPNTLPNGVKRIETKDPFGGTSYLYANKEEDATWGNDSTVNQHRGVNAIYIRSDYAPLLPPQIQFVKTLSGVNESATILKLVVYRKYGNSDSSKVKFSIASATATLNSDYKLDTTKQIVFRPYGNVTDTINVTILTDAVTEPTEFITVKLIKPVKAKLGPDVSHNIEIYDAVKPISTFFFRGNKVPLYCASGDTTRTPIVFQAKIAGFNSNVRYKYFVSFISIADTSSISATGAGSDLFFSSTNTNISYGANPGFTTGNFDTLVIGPSGEYLGWFGGLNTNDSRFTAGKYVYPMIVLQEIDSVTKPIMKYFLYDSILVLKYATAAGSTNGTAIYGNSFAKNKNIVLLYENVLGITNRPTSITYLESDGNTVSKMPNFYSTKVNGVAGAWGTIIPNNLSNGIKRIEVMDPKSLNLFEYANKEADATWGGDSTINPRKGLKPIYIKSDYAPLVAPDLQFVANVTNVKESNTTIKLAVRRKYGNDDTTKVAYFVAGSNATAGLDYTFNTGKTLVFKPYGDLLDTVTITMNILDDNLSDPNENIAVKLQNSQNGLIGLQSTNTVNIIDNDTPFISFAAKGIKVSETAGSIKVRVKIKTSPSTPTNVKLLVKYKGYNTKIPQEFKIGSSQKDTNIQFSGAKFNDSIDVKVPIINDTFTVDGNDTIIFVLRSLSSPGTITKDSLYTLVISDDDAPPIYTFAKKALSVKENAGSISFRINIAGRNVNQSDFNLKFISGASTATQGQDLTFSPTTKIITVSPTDPDSIIVTVPILNNNLYETKEDAVFIMTNSLNARIGKPDTLRISILDDDMVEYPISKVITSKPASGVADSLNTKCKLRGVVYGGNLKPGGTPNGFLFTLIDPTGGIQVISSTGDKGYTVTEGDSIYVIGTIGQFEGMIQLQNIDSLIKIASGRALKAAASTVVLNESTESKLVKLDVVRVANSSQWPTTALAANTSVKVKLINQTDSFFMLIDSETDIDGTPAPPAFISVTGLGGQADPSNPFTTGYLIAPRRLTDIKDIVTPVFSFVPIADTTQEWRDSINKFILKGTNIISNQQINVVIKGGTATRSPSTGGDYKAGSTTFTFLLTPAQPSVAVSVPLNDDKAFEPDETIIFAIRNNPYGTLIGKDSVHTHTIRDDETNSIKEVLSKETSLYPNPAKGVLNINTTSVILKVSIYDINGKLVYTLENINELSAVLNTENLVNGIYNVTITTDKGTITKPFSKLE